MILYNPNSVSIPSRGLWVFPLEQMDQDVSFLLFQSLVGVYGFSRKSSSPNYSFKRQVSIPSRGLWVFPPDGWFVTVGEVVFQSLVGVYGFSR